MSDLEPTLRNDKGEVIAWQLGTTLVPGTAALTLSPERQQELDAKLEKLDELRRRGEIEGEKVIIL